MASTCPFPDFTEPFDHSDVAFRIEGRLLYSNKGLLSSYSPVFNRLFNGEFKEGQSSATEILLPEKKFDDIQELFRCLHLNPQKELDGKLLRICPYDVMQCGGWWG